MDLPEERLARAISASSRRQILRILIKGPKTVKEISHLSRMSVSLTSRHLKLLYDLGFLDVKIKFPHKFYSLKIKDLKSVLDAYDVVISKL